MPDELLRALLDMFSAVDAVVEGHVTTTALRSSEGAYPTMPKVERPPILVPRALRKDVKDDPFVRARDYEAAAARLEPTVREALERGERHAFVATDLLWLDGQSLLDVPLLERRRILEGVLDEAYLVRRSAIVRPSAVLTLVTWGALGLQGPQLPRGELALPRGPGEPGLGDHPRPRRPGRRPEARRAPLRLRPNDAGSARATRLQPPRQHDGGRVNPCQRRP